MPKGKYKLNIKNTFDMAECEIELNRMKNSGASNDKLNKYIKNVMIRKSEIKIGDVVRIKSFVNIKKDKFFFVENLMATFKDNSMVFYVCGIAAIRQGDIFVVLSKKICVPYVRCIKVFRKGEFEYIKSSGKNFFQIQKQLKLSKSGGKEIEANQCEYDDNDGLGFFDKNFEKDFDDSLDF